MLKHTLRQPVIPLRCNIDEGIFSKALFACRLLTGVGFIYLALGCLFYWREFLVNVHWIGIPFAWPLSFLLAGAELFAGLFLILGWHTRINAAMAWPLSMLCCWVFFAGNYNAVCIVLLLQISAALSVLFMLGSGKISLDYKRSQRAARRF